jgi:single-stranded-DNA-specific exonuclease
MMKFLKNFTSNVEYFHSQRSIGHGIFFGEDNIPADTKLLLIVDSSTNDMDCVERISKRGIDVLIIDHHQQSVPSRNCILINPQQSGCLYPNKSISGSVAVHKVCQVLDEYLSTDYADEYTDLAGIGLIGDMMNMFYSNDPISYENRYTVKTALNGIKNLGVQCLLELLNIKHDNLTTNSFSFSIVPCVNSACRLDRIEVILELLMEDDFIKATELAKSVIAMNDERKEAQALFKERLLPMINHEDKCFILIDETIGKGFKGLISGDFCNEFHKPVITLSTDEDGLTYSGSYRSYKGYDLQSFLRSIPEIEYAEGHPPAGGCKFKVEDLNKIKKYFNDNFEQKSEDQYIEFLMELNIEDINQYFIRDVEEFFRISGTNFEVGNFLIKNIIPIEKKVMGKGKNTIKLLTTRMDKTYFMDEEDFMQLESMMSLMKFRTNSEYFPDELLKKECEFIGTLSLNSYPNWKTKKLDITNQLFIEDYRLVN